MRVRKLMLGGMMMVLLVSLVGCGGGGGESTAKKNANLVVSDKDPFYEPNNLEVSLNQETTWTVYNDGKKVHNITIPGFAVDMDVEPGKSITVKLPAVSAAPRDGFFTMYCKFHQADGEATRIKIAKK